MDFEVVKSALAKGDQHLGDMVFWDLAQARIGRATLEALWSEAQLDAELLPDTPTPEKALKIATRESQAGHSDRLIRLAKEDKAEIVFAIVRERKPGNGTLQYKTEATLTLDRTSGGLSTTQPQDGLVATISSRFELYCTTHHPDDVRRTIVKTLRSFAAFSLRDGGGVHFVPDPCADRLRRLKSAVDKIGNSTVHLLPIHQSPEAKQTLGQIAKGSIEEELKALQTEIESFLQVPPDRASTLMRRFDAFESLRSRARLYRDMLQVEVQDLDCQLRKMSAAVEGMLDQKNAA
jgi:hypothetical protein